MNTKIFERPVSKRCVRWWSPDSASHCCPSSLWIRRSDPSAASPFGDSPILRRPAPSAPCGASPAPVPRSSARCSTSWIGSWRARLKRRDSRMAKPRPATRQTAASRSVQSADWAFHADDDAVLAALVSGRHSQEFSCANTSARSPTRNCRRFAAGRKAGQEAARSEGADTSPGIMAARRRRATRCRRQRPIAAGRAAALSREEGLDRSAGRMAAGRLTDPGAPGRRASGAARRSGVLFCCSPVRKAQASARDRQKAARRKLPRL